MANNPTLYNAVITGITSGNQQRWLLPDANGVVDFTIFRRVCEVVATAIDTRIGVISNINDSQITLMESICQGFFQHRAVENIRHELNAIADEIVNIFSDLNNILEPVPGDAPFIVPGEYTGQPVYWDGDKYAPLPAEEGLSLNELSVTTVDEHFVGIVMNAESNYLGIGSQDNPLGISDDFSPQNQIALVVFNTSAVEGGYNALIIGQTAITLTENMTEGDGPTTYEMTSGSHLFKIEGTTVLEMKLDAGVMKIGFFGRPPIAQPIITTGTTQQQLDQIIAALHNYGLIFDDR